MRFPLFFVFIGLLAAFPVNAAQRNLEINWSVPAGSEVEPAGYRLYMNGGSSPVCASDEPAATAMTCVVEVAGNSAAFTMTSISAENLESPHSTPFEITFDQTLTAFFSHDPSSGPVPLPVSFDAGSSTGEIVDYTWDFGDGSTTTGRTATHTFTTSGTYTVTLTVSDLAGSDSTTSVIIVTETGSEGKNHPPIASMAVTPGNGKSPLLVNLDASSSYDPDGDPLTYSWDFGDGSTGTGIKTTHIYHNVGILTARLTVTDSSNAGSSTSIPIMVTSPDPQDPASPVAVISKDPLRGVVVRKPCTLRGNNSKPSTQSGAITTYLWDFGDGSTGAGPQVEHSYQTIGDYTVTLTVIDSSGKTASNKTVVNVITQEEADRVAFLLPVYQLLLGTTSSLPTQQTDKGAK